MDEDLLRPGERTRRPPPRRASSSPNDRSPSSSPTWGTSTLHCPRPASFVETTELAPTRRGRSRRKLIPCMLGAGGAPSVRDEDHDTPPHSVDGRRSLPP